MIDQMTPDTYYHVKLRAHNVIGYSNPTSFYLKTARGKDEIGFENYNTYYAGVSTSSSTIHKLHVFCSIIILSSFMFTL
jgi:hypothetical protein